jgi:hypothetical protein
MTPWRIVERKGCFIVADGSGSPLAHIFFADDDERRMATGQMSRDDAFSAAMRLIDAQNARLASGKVAEKIEFAQRALTASLHRLH